MYRMQNPLLPSEQEKVVTSCVAAGMAVHRELGPGFKERIYQQAYALELDSQGVRFECEKMIEVTYREWKIPGQRIDLIVEGIVLVEIKAVPVIKALHHAQVRSYLKTTGIHVGLLLNFNSLLLKDGLKRIAL
jgi:GxxExxY protein